MDRRHIPTVKPIRNRVDTATTDRLAAWARNHLASLTPERRAELNREWNA